MSELIGRLRQCAPDGIQQEAADEIERLEDRLEVYDSTGKVRMPEDCDGIACRDATIRLLDERVEALSCETKDFRVLAKFVLDQDFVGAELWARGNLDAVLEGLSDD